VIDVRASTPTATAGNTGAAMNRGADGTAELCGDFAVKAACK
jgi:hypothetical protein